MLQEAEKGIQIFGISETHLNKSIKDNEVRIDGYNIVRKDRKQGPGGGVCIFIRNDLPWQRRMDLENDEKIEAIWIEIFLQKSRSILICVLYRPPETSSYFNRDFDLLFDDMLTTVNAESKEVILAGDINCNYLKDSESKGTKEIIQSNGLKQMIKSPTRITKETRTLIDIIACTHDDRVMKASVYSNAISDRELTGIIRKVNCKRFVPRRIYTRNYRNYDKSSYKDDVKNISWGYKTSQGINTEWNSFKNQLIQCVNKHAPLVEKTVSGRDCPWLTSEIKSHIRERDFYLRRAKRTGTELDWSTYRRMRNKVTLIIRKSKANHNRTLFRENIKSPKEFWKKIKQIYQKENDSANTKVFKIDNELVTDKQRISNSFCLFFTNVASTLQGIVKIGDNAWNYKRERNLKAKIILKGNDFNLQK